MRGQAGRSSRRLVSVVFVAIVVAGVAAGPTSAQVPTADVIGAITAPFEEGGAAVPRCVTEPGGELDCKPVGQAVAVLKDGRIFYYNGIEGHENMKNGTGTDLSPEMRDSEARVMDLRSGVPTWITPLQPDGGATNPDIQRGSEWSDDPLATAGVPGRPGDGLVGSTWGALGLPPHEPTNNPDDAADNDVDMFCSELVSLDDGRIMVIGGSDWYNEPSLMDANKGDQRHLGLVEVAGIKNSRIYDPETNSFTQTGHMKYPRWYPSAVTLSDGKVFVASGTVKLIKPAQLSHVRRTETYDPATNAFTENYTGMDSENSMPMQPRIFLTPNGKLFYTGFGQSWIPSGEAADEVLWSLQQFFDLETKKWEIVGPAPLGSRDLAQALALPMDPPYDKMTILNFGGTMGPSPGSWAAVPFSTLTTVDKQGNVHNELTGNLAQGRWFPSGVLLPDGKVIATVGARFGEAVMPGAEVPLRTIEMWDPATGQWTETLESARDRTYHNSAVLLPDARVLIGGHSPVARFFGNMQDAGKPFPNNEKDPSFEVYSPPYLFFGERPRISGVQSGVRWGETFDIKTPNASEIKQVLLMRVPSPQHANDSDTRTLRLAFQKTADGLSAIAPPDGVAAPPGWYYLFLNKGHSKGLIPSVARMVHVGETSDLSEALQPMPDDAAPPLGSANADEDTSDTAQAGAQVNKVLASAADAAPSAAGVPVESLRALPTSSGRPVSVPAAAPVAILVAAGATSLGLRRFRRR
jgi:hypothetical protein